MLPSDIESTETTMTSQFMKNKKFFTEYSEHILNTFFEAESRYILIKKRSDQLEVRPMLIELLKKFSKHQQYSMATLHLAVYILDVYMDNYILSDFSEHQKLVALVCLLLAAKSDDLDELVPSIKDLLRIVDMSDDLGVDLRIREQLEPRDVRNAFKRFASMYCKLEFLIFECVDFNTVRPTTLSFLLVFQNIILTEADVESDSEKTVGDMRVSANEFVNQFLDIVIQDIDFFNMKPSRIAAAIVAATRKLLNVKNFWNESLEQLTRYTIEEILPTVGTLMEKRIRVLYDLKNDEQDDVNMKDSGYCPTPDSFSDTSLTEEDEPQCSKKRKLSDRSQNIIDIM